MKTPLRSPECAKLLRSWHDEPRDSVRFRMLIFSFDHTDFEIRDLLLTFLDEDPPDSEAGEVVRELWPLLLLTDPPHLLEDLSDEIAAVIRDHELLAARMEMLAAKYPAVQPWSDMWDRYPHEDPQFGHNNIDETIRKLQAANRMSTGYVRESLGEARHAAAKVQVYTEAVQS